MKILNVKELIVGEGKASEVSLIKLIHTGRILVNEKTVGEYGVKENDHMVLMVTKPAKTIPTVEKTAEPTPSSADPKAKAQEEPEEDPELEQKCKNIVEMGFPDRDIVMKALKLANGDPDRAVELLESGDVFDVLEQEENEGSDEKAPEYDENNPNPLAFLRDDPQFQRLRSIVQTNPQLLPPLLEQLRTSSPQLFDLINNHSHAFVQMMQEGLESELGDNSDLNQQHHVQVTEEEHAAIERLQQMFGIEKARVVEAFLACERNEELAANYLLEHGHDDDQDD